MEELVEYVDSARQHNRPSLWKDYIKYSQSTYFAQFISHNYMYVMIVAVFCRWKWRTVRMLWRSGGVCSRARRLRPASARSLPVGFNQILVRGYSNRFHTIVLYMYMYLCLSIAIFTVLRIFLATLKHSQSVQVFVSEAATGSSSLLITRCSNMVTVWRAEPSCNFFASDQLRQRLLVFHHTPQSDVVTQTAR